MTRYEMMPSRLCLALAALLIGIGIVAAQTARGADADPTGRVIAVVHRFAPHEEGEIGVSEDRRTLFVILCTRHQMGRGRPIRFDDQRVDVFDVSQPPVPRRIATLPLSDRFRDGLPAQGSFLFIPGFANKFSGGLLPIGPSRPSDIMGTRGFVFERTSQRAITGDLSTIYLWDLETAPPRMTASIGLGALPLDARFLAPPGVLAVLNTRGIELVATAPRPYDPARLQVAHRLLLTQYNDSRARHGGKLNNALASADLYDQLVAAMKDVGVTKLMSNEGGLTHSARVKILNDYGYWLSQTNEPWTAVPVLTKVVELAPRRAVAQMNLANAALTALPLAGTWQEKRALSETVVKARAAYQRLTGKTLPGAAGFAAFNVVTAANDDVCDYVAGFYNRGRQTEMFGFPNPVDIAGDGKLRYVYIYHMGTAHVPGIVATAKPLTSDDLDYGSPEGDVNFFMSDDKGGPEFEAEPHVFPFRKDYYVLYARPGPVTVYRPNRGAVCRFIPHYTPILTEDRDSGICARAVAGQSFKRVPTRNLASSRVLRGAEALIRRGGPIQLGAEADVILDPGSTPVRVGYFGLASTAGAGCGLGGIAILDKDRTEDSPRNHALLALESKTLGCGGSTAFLVRVAGQTLIEMDSSQWRGRGIVARSLFRLRGERVAPVCRVEQRATYEPEQVQGGRDPPKP